VRTEFQRVCAYLGILALVLVGGFPSSVFGQAETGQVLGVVTDAQGKAIPNAKVTVRNVGTGAERTASTDDRGEYVITNLLPAAYEARAEIQGFRKTQRQVQIAPGARATIDFTLEVGQITELVEVTADQGAAINTESQTLGSVISRKDLEELPLLTRNPYDLIGTTGFAASTQDSGMSMRGGGFQLNGARAAGNNILLDGASNNDEFTADVGQRVPLDSVQEFSVLTSNYTAEYGRASGGVVNVVTKSGTNDFHGTAYAFGRYSALASNDFDSNAKGLPKAVFTRNQFGYSVGGPVVKEKLFFFQSTEWLRIRSSANNSVDVIDPSFLALTNGNTQGFYGALGKLRPSFQQLGVVTKGDLGLNSANGCVTLGTCPTFAALPDSQPVFDSGSYTTPTDAGAGLPINDTQVVGRVDWVHSQRTQVYVRYALQKNTFLTGTNTNSPYAGYDSGQTDTNNNSLVSVTHSLTPNTVSQSKLVFNRLNNLQPLGTNPVGPTLYFSASVGATDPGTGNLIALPGYSPFTPGNAIPFGGPQNFVQAYQDFSTIKGKHNFRYGGSYVYIRDNRTFGAYEEAVETLTTKSSVGPGLENFMNGNIQQFQAAVYPQGKFPCGATVTPNCTLTLPVTPPSFARSNRYHEFAFYGQDAWRVSRRVTLNLGLRWEYFGVQHNKNPNLDSNYYDGTGGSVFDGIRSGDVATAPTSPIHGLWKKDWNNFGPRVGLAFDVFGDGKTSFRGGYGISYERNFGNVTFNLIQNPPNYAVVSLTAGVDVPGTIPIAIDNAGPLGGSSGTKALPKTSLRNVNSNITTAYTHQYGAALEHQFHQGLFAAVEYSGSKGVNLYSIENPNLSGAGNVFLGDPDPTPGDPAGLTRLRTTQFSNINRRGNGGFSNYNAVNFRFDVRNYRNTGLSLRTNYTYAHSIDNLSSTFSEGSTDFNLGLLDPFNPKLDRGNSEFDMRHRFVVSGTWDIPLARNTHGFVNRIANGWTIAPIFTAQTGVAFGMYDCTNAFAVCPRAMVGAGGPPKKTGGILADNGQNSFDYFNIAGMGLDSTYVNPIVGFSDFGPFPSTMMSRGYFRGPGKWNVDAGVYKTTKITERFSLQLRGEFFNAFNHSNLYLVPSTFEVSGNTAVQAKRGVIPVLGVPNERRNIQMALKLLF
jgi:outer membrane receptor protein involved in Fe transport